MSTVQEIQAAIQSLPEIQRFELMHWLHSTYEEMSPEEEAQLLAEAEEGAREIAEGKGVPLEELYKRTRSWTLK